MTKSLCLAITLIVGAIGVPASNSVYAAASPGLPKPCQAGGGPLSINKGPLATQDFRYAGQPVLQNSESPLGATSDEVHANFAGIIEANFQNGSTEHLLSNLSERELSDLAKLYSARSQGKTQPLLKIFAQRLSDQSLVRVAKVFGPEQVAAAVSEYASPSVQSSFNTKMESIETPKSSSNLMEPMATPTLDMTIPEIYLEFRTAPVGSAGPAASIAETTMYVSKNIAFAASAGWAIGTGISNLIETYDPSLNEAIGGTVAGMVDASYQSWDYLQQGKYQASFDSLFGYPVTNSGNPSGDFGEFGAMDYFWSTVCFN